ncbi:MAG: ornithine cyclodeaminase family protein [Kiloniellales bacterium]
MSAEPLWISEQEVVELLSLGEAIVALESGLRLEAEGKAHNMAKTHAKWGHGETLHAIGAVMEGAGFVGTKTWAHTEGGACPLLLLFDSASGALLAVIEAFALGQMRTGGISGLAAKLMAREDATEMAIVGAGKQAVTQVAAVAAVRPLKRLRVFSPRAGSREAFAKKIAERFEFKVETAASAEAAVKDAEIVTLVTRATAPVVDSAMLAKGAHINAVGAIVPERVEFAQDVFDRVGLIAVDSPDSVKRLSREFIDRFGKSGDWSAVKPISALIAAGKGRPAGADLTLFKAMGMGLSDLAVAREVLARARKAGKGRPLPQPTKAQPRLT